MSSILNLFTRRYDFTVTPAVNNGFQSKAALNQTDEKKMTLKIMEAIKPYFLAPYEDAGLSQIANRQIQDTKYIVNRYNHGLAHGLRQGALAKDILTILINLKNQYEILDHHELESMSKWLLEKTKADNNFFHKVDFTSSFQRSGRQSEISHVSNAEKYKEYERQDAVNFKKAALSSHLFKDVQEITIFEESILWSNKGNLDEELFPDLKYLRRILHAAHTFDLRRITCFDEARIRKDGIKQLLGIQGDFKGSDHCDKIESALWDRSGMYLEATGDRDLTCRAYLDNKFFLQTAEPVKMAEAILHIRERVV